MTKWRNRVEADRLQTLLQETISLGRREGFIRPQELTRVNVDTTVQEKNITYPTDSKLLYKSIEELGTVARSRGIQLRQSYIRVGKRMSVKASRYAHARQYKRMQRSLRSAIESKIGHLKSDHRMNRCFLAGLNGDATNAILAAADSNLRKLLRRFAAALMHWLTCLANRTAQDRRQLLVA